MTSCSLLATANFPSAKRFEDSENTLSASFVIQSLRDSPFNEAHGEGGLAESERRPRARKARPRSPLRQKLMPLLWEEGRGWWLPLPPPVSLSLSLPLSLSL